jgi:hypothetical protein
MSGVCDPSGDALTFPVGAVLLTGRSIVPDESFSLRRGVVVTIDIPCIGTLTTRSSASAGIPTRSNHLDQE